MPRTSDLNLKFEIRVRQPRSVWKWVYIKVNCIWYVICWSRIKQTVGHITTSSWVPPLHLMSRLNLSSSKIKCIFYYLNMFLERSFRIHLYKGNHNHHSCFYTLKTSDRNKFLPRIHQYLRKKRTYMQQKPWKTTTYRLPSQYRTLPDDFF